jgi:sulfonate transport system substrate-binding protein
MRNKHGLLHGILPILGLLLALNHTFVLADETPTEIRIAVVANDNASGKVVFIGAPQLIAQDPILKAELDRRHITLKWIPAASSSVAALVNEAFTSHSIDFAFYGDLPSVILNASGFQTRLVAPGSLGNNVYLVVPPNSTVRSIADLKGKRIALHRGRPWEVTFGKLLAANGLKFSEFHIVNLNPQAGAAALAAGSVDAFFTLSDAYVLADKGVGKIIWSTKNEPDDWKMRAELWGTAEFVRKYPDLTQLLVNADVRAVHWISEQQHRDAYIKDQARFGYPESVIQRDAEAKGVSWQDYWSPLYTPTITDHYLAVARYAHDTGLIRGTVDAQALILPQFVQAAIKQLGLTGYWH